MSDTRGLLDRISAFRQRLDATPQLIPEGVPVAGDDELPVATEIDEFRATLRGIVGVPPAADVPSGPVPQFTDRAQRLLGSAKQLLDRQRAFTDDPHFSGLSAKDADPDPLVGYHRETVGVLDAIVRLAQGFPDSPSAQLKLCDGLDGLLSVVRDRLAVQERALGQRRTDAARLDRLAGFYTALHTNQPATLQAVAALGEELLEDSRQARPLRFLTVSVTGTESYPGGPVFPAPTRFVAAHAINTAQVVARLLPYDYEWAGRPLAPVVAALLMDCGMPGVSLEVLGKSEPLTADERRLLEAHPKIGAELLMWRFPNMAGPLAAAVATHHERADGTGYPGGLAGENLPPLGRLLRVADTYAALRADRPHRPALDPRAALTEVLLMAEQGQLDRDFAEYLLNLSFYPVGSVVELTDGRLAVVVANHPNRIDPRSPARPVVAVLSDADGSLLPRAEHVDLGVADRGGIARGVPATRARELLGSRYPEIV